MKSFLFYFFFRFLKTNRFSFSFYITEKNYFRFYFRFHNENRSGWGFRFPSRTVVNVAMHTAEWCDRWSYMFKLSVMRLRCSKTAEWSEVLFGMKTLWGPRHDTVLNKLNRGPNPPRWREACGTILPHVKYGTFACIRCGLHSITLYWHVAADWLDFKHSCTWRRPTYRMIPVLILFSPLGFSVAYRHASVTRSHSSVV